MSETQIDIQEVLKNLREQIGLLSQEIAILKATLSAQKSEDKVQ